MGKDSAEAGIVSFAAAGVANSWNFLQMIVDMIFFLVGRLYVVSAMLLGLTWLLLVKNQPAQ